MFKDNLFKDKIVVVTGGGTGIGLATSVLFAKLGGRIAIAQRSQEHIDNGIKEISKYGECIGFKVDLRNFESVEDFFKNVVDKYGRIDILINNAGGQFLAKMEKISPNGFDAVVKTNLYNIFYCCKVAGEYMKKQKFGRIINMSTIYAAKSAAGMLHSGAARSGVLNLTRSLALEWGKYNITVNAIAPGFVATEGMKEELFENDEKALEKLKKEVPLQRFATVEEVAESIVYMAKADYMNGHTLVLDGGCEMINWPKIY